VDKLRPQRESKTAPPRPEVSSEEARSTEKQAVSSTDAHPEPTTFVDEVGPKKKELEKAIRSAMAAAILAGDDARADELRTMLVPKSSAPVVRLVKR